MTPGRDIEVAARRDRALSAAGPSIRTLLLALVGAVTLPLVLLVVAGLAFENHQQREYEAARARSAAAAMAARLDDAVGGIESALQAAANALAEDIARPREAASRIAGLHAGLVRLVTDVALVARDGGVVAGAGRSPTSAPRGNAIDANLIPEMLASGPFGVSQLRPDRTTGTERLYAWRTVASTHGGDAAALLVLTLDRDRLGELLGSAEIPPGLSVTLVDTRSALISRAGLQTVADGSTHDGTRRLVASAVTRVGWGIRLYATAAGGPPALRLPAAWTAVAIAAALFAVALVSAWWIALRISSPLRALGDGVRRLASGESTALALSGPREVAQLATEVGGMAVLLRGQHDRLRLQFDRLPLGCMTFDVSMRIVDCNPAAASLFGYDASELVGCDAIQMLFPAKSRSAARALARGRSGSATPLAGVHENMARDGRTLLCEWHNAPLVDEDGRVTGYMSTVLDVTARVQAERALREAEERWQFALEGAGDGVWDWRVTSGEVVFSRRWKAMLGYAEGEIGSGIGERDSRIHPDDRAAMYAALQAHFDGRVRYYASEHRVRARNGEYRWILDRGMIVERDDGDRPVRMIGTYTDVTERRLAEQQLREAEERWQFALEGAGDGVFDWDIAAGHAYRSPRLQQILGFEPGELSSELSAFDALVHPDDLPDMVRARQSHLRGELPYFAAEYRVRHKDGREIWIASRGKVMRRDATGTPLRLIGTVSDITARKQAEFERLQLLAEKQMLADRLQLVLDSAPIGCMILDREFRAEYVNSAVERLFGRDRTELLGRDPVEEAATDDCVARIRSRKVLMLGGERQPAVVYHVRRPDGEIRAAESLPVPLRGADGTVVGVLSMLIDVTERQRAEAALRASEQRYRSLVEVAPDGVAVICRGEVEYANDALARLLRVDPAGPLVGRRFADLFVPGERDEVEASLAAMELEIGQTVGAERQVVAADGTVIDVDVRGGAYRTAEGVRVQVVVRDISVRKLIHRRVLEINAELERRVSERTAELQAANRELEAFSYSVAHDLRSPLRAIDGYTRMLEEDLGAAVAPLAKRQIERVHANVMRMAELIDDLLEYARVGRRDLELKPVDAGAVAADVAEELAAAYPAATIRVDPLPHVRADATLLRQVFANLVGNALKFSASAQAPEIQVGCLTVHGEHVFHVQDNGVGFSMDHAHMLFGVFQRLHGVSEFEGTGVGLAIVQRAVQRHGGRVWAESEPGRGATFYFALPAA